jgi:uncharacterized membrane protein
VGGGGKYLVFKQLCSCIVLYLLSVFIVSISLFSKIISNVRRKVKNKFLTGTEFASENMQEIKKISQEIVSKNPFFDFVSREIFFIS